MDQAGVFVGEQQPEAAALLTGQNRIFERARNSFHSLQDHMNITSLGKKVAAVGGTPVPIAATWTSVQRLVFCQDPAGTATVFIGSPTMNTTTGAGVYAAILPATATGLTMIVTFGETEDEVDLSQFAIASATVGQGCFVSYEIR